jgi:hypothetical protein
MLPDDLPVFPDPRHAEPDGLLAIGGGLEPARVLMAYARGIFPWSGVDEPLTWFCPAPRMVIGLPDGLHVPRSLAKTRRRRSVAGDARHRVRGGDGGVREPRPEQAARGSRPGSRRCSPAARARGGPQRRGVGRRRADRRAVRAGDRRGCSAARACSRGSRRVEAGVRRARPGSSRAGGSADRLPGRDGAPAAVRRGGGRAGGVPRAAGRRRRAGPVGSGRGRSTRARRGPHRGITRPSTATSKPRRDTSIAAGLAGSTAGFEWLRWVNTTRRRRRRPAAAAGPWCRTSAGGRSR